MIRDRAARGRRALDAALARARRLRLDRVHQRERRARFAALARAAGIDAGALAARVLLRRPGDRATRRARAGFACARAAGSRAATPRRCSSRCAASPPRAGACCCRAPAARRDELPDGPARGGRAGRRRRSSYRTRPARGRRRRAARELVARARSTRSRSRARRRREASPRCSMGRRRWPRRAQRGGGDRRASRPRARASSGCRRMRSPSAPEPAGAGGGAGASAHRAPRTETAHELPDRRACAACAARETLRGMVRETRLTRDDLVLPLFVVEGRACASRSPRCRACYRLSVDQLVNEAKQVADVGVPGRDPLRHPGRRRTRAAAAPMRRTASCSAPSRAQARACPTLLVITDVCLCEYTDHGHCGHASSGERRRQRRRRSSAWRGRRSRTPRRRRHGRALAT